MSRRILAAEDTPALRALIQLCLTRAGYAVDLAEDGEEAVKLFVASAYDAVVMDIQMPVMDGLAAVARMRENEKGRGAAPAPILALTANTEPADLRRCLDAGFSATVRKPFGREELLQALAKELDAASAADRIVVSVDPDIAELVPPFLDACRTELVAMRAALGRGDFPAIVAESHKLAGAGATYGFDPLSAEGRNVESAAKASDESAVRRGLDALERYLARISISP